MGKISDIPKLKAALAQRMEQLGGVGVGMSDKTAATAGLVTPDEFSRDLLRPEAMSERTRAMFTSVDGVIPREMVERAARRATSRFVGDPDPVEINRHLLAENERLKAERDAAERRNNEMERKLKPVRFNPATGRDELWDIEAELKDISAQIPRERRLEGFTLAGAVAEMAKLLAAAEARATPDDQSVELLRAVKLEPGMLIALRGGETTTHAVLRRVAEGIDKALRGRFGSMSYGSPTVVLLPPDACMETVPTGGRGPVQVNLHEGRKSRPTDVPKHVARDYAFAAAASYGVTPEVVRVKRAERRAAAAVRLGLGPAPVEVGQYLRCGSLLARVEGVHVRRDYRCWYLDLALCDADGMPLPTEGDEVSGLSGPASELLTQFVSKVSAPMPRGERRPIGPVIGWEDPDDMLLADAPPAGRTDPCA